MKFIKNSKKYLMLLLVVSFSLTTNNNLNTMNSQEIQKSNSPISAKKRDLLISNIQEELLMKEIVYLTIKQEPITPSGLLYALNNLSELKHAVKINLKYIMKHIDFYLEHHSLEAILEYISNFEEIRNEITSLNRMIKNQKSSYKNRFKLIKKILSAKYKRNETFILSMLTKIKKGLVLQSYELDGLKLVFLLKRILPKIEESYTKSIEILENKNVFSYEEIHSYERQSIILNRCLEIQKILTNAQHKFYVEYNGQNIEAIFNKITNEIICNQITTRKLNQLIMAKLEGIDI